MKDKQVEEKIELKTQFVMGIDATGMKEMNSREEET